MTRKTILAVVFTVLVAALLCIAGCSGDNKGSSSSQASSSSASSVSYTLTIGDPKAGGAEFLLKNNTGKEVTIVNIKATQDSAYPSSPLVMSSKTFAAGSTAQVFAPKIEAASNSDVALKATASIQLTCSDGTVYELHQVDINNIEDAAVSVEGDVAYLTYTSKNSKSNENTLSSEQAIAAAAVAATAAAPSPAQEQDAAPQSDEGSNDSPADDGNGSGNDDPGPSDEGSSEPSGDNSSVDDSAVGGGNEDDCVVDPILR